MRFSYYFIFSLSICLAGCHSAKDVGKTDTEAPSIQPSLEIPGVSLPVQGVSNSNEADTKILYSENDGKAVLTKDLEVDQTSLEIDENAQKNGFVISLKAHFPKLGGSPLIRFKGDIDSNGQFTLYPDEVLHSDFIINGFGECYTIENPDNNKCDSIYLELVVKIHDEYFYKQLSFPKVEYAISKNAQPEQIEVTPSNKNNIEEVTKTEIPVVAPKDTSISQPAPPSEQKLISQAPDQSAQADKANKIPDPKMPAKSENVTDENISNADFDDEDCDKPEMKGSPLCEPPGRLEGLPIKIEQIKNLTYTEQKKSQMPLPSTSENRSSDPVTPKKNIAPPTETSTKSAPSAQPAKGTTSSPPIVDNQTPVKIRPVSMQAFGSYVHGSLKSAAYLDVQNGLFFKNQLDREAIYGTTELVNFVNSFTRVYLNITSQKLMVSNLSEQNGGPLKVFHKSHENGLDADISYPASVTSATMLVSVVPGKAKPGHPQGELEITKTWTLFKWIVKNASVNLILVHPFVKDKMCAYAKQVGELYSEQETLIKLYPDSSHFNHFHVRLDCQVTDRLCMRDRNPPKILGCNLK